MEPRNADEAARQLVIFGLHEDIGEDACAEKIRLLFPDADAERTIAAAIRWNNGREK